MKTSRIFGMVVLAAVWLWLAWAVLATGFNLKNILIVAMTAVIIFVPLYKKYFASDQNNKNDNRR